MTYKMQLSASGPSKSLQNCGFQKSRAIKLVDEVQQSARSRALCFVHPTTRQLTGPPFGEQFGHRNAVG
ncbi:hypothetical protein LIA77_00591 [Sarocladium implicatum]|nr:hypothetical protein LIA77_00591 [Sarocladium implicatum]